MTRNLWKLEAVALVFALSQGPAIAQQYGPPSTGPNSAVIMIPGTVNLVAGLNGAATAGSPSTWGNGGLATAAQLNFPMGIAYDSNGNLYIADSNDYEVRKISATTGDISDFAGTGTQSTSPTAPTATTQATAESIGTLSGLAIDSSNNVYFADRTNNIIWKVTPGGVISIFAGTGSGGYTGDTGLATSATIQNPQGLAFDGNGNLYIDDSNNNVVRIIGTNGKINTFAGNGTGHGEFPTCPSSIPTLGSSTAATSVALCQPQGVAADSAGNIYLSSFNQVYKVATNGNISAFAGTATGGDTGDGGMATSAELGHPMGLYADPAGDVYIADQSGGFIREVNTAGTINTVYGDGVGDVTHAIIGEPDTESESTSVGDSDGDYFITMDPDGNLVVSIADASAIFSAGSEGGYFFGHNNEIYTTSTSTSLNASAPAVYPPYITLSNPSGVTLDFTAVPTVTGPFGLDGGTCGFPGTLAPGDSCTVIPSFTPTVGNNTLATGTITFPSNANNVTQSITVNTSPLTIDLSGYGIGSPTPSATLLPALSFSSPLNVTTSAKTVTFTNNGTAPLYLTSTQFSTTANNPFAVTGTTCPNTTTALAVGATCTYSITFDPTQAINYSNEFQVDVQYYNSSNVLTNYGFESVGLTGMGVGSLTLTPAAFGDVVVNATSILVATFTNGTSAAMTGTTYSITGPNASNFAITTGTNSCGTQVNGAGGTCNIYVAFTPNSATSFSATLQVSGTNSSTEATEGQTASLTGTGVVFSSPVGTAEAMQLVTINITTAGTLNIINAFMQGIPNLDFTSITGGTCEGGTAYTVGQSCTVEVIFDPTAPGVRSGAIVLTDSSNNVLGTTYLAGYATSPLIAFGPPVQSSLLSTNTYAPVGLTLDAGRNLYFVDGTSSHVYKLPWNGTGYGAAVALGTGYNEPQGVAVDGAGNVYVGNYAGGTIIKIPWNGAAYGTQTTVPLSGGAQQPKHLIVDGYGNIFYINYAQGALVQEVPWNGTSYGATVTVPFTGLNSPNGVAVDQNGDVFCADTYGFNVLMLPKTSSGYGTQVTVVGGLTGHPIGVALDPNGNVYVAVQGNATNQGAELIEVPFTSGSYGAPVSLPETSPTGLQDVALDSLGNIYTANFATAQVYELNTAAAPSLTFASTNVNSDTDPAQTVSVTNIGNASLNFSGATNPYYPTDFPVNSSASSLCAQGNTLTPNSTCNISINFKPITGGLHIESVALADNNQNNPAATQSIAVSATGLVPVVPAASLSPNPLTFGGEVYEVTSPAQAVVLSNTGGAALTGITPTLTGTNPTNFAIVTGANACGSTLAAGSSCNIWITFKPINTGNLQATLSVADNASPSPQTATLTGTYDYFYANVGATLAAQPVTVYIATAGTLSSIQVLTQGAANLDFTETSGGTCTATTAYTVGQSCTVDVVFTPQAPGARLGSVLLTDAGGNVLGTAYVPGTGQAPEIVYGTGVQTTLPTFSGGSYNEPFGVTVDAGLNVYVADAGHGWIIKTPWTGTAYGAPVRVPTGSITLVDPSAVAVDGSGNVFIADTGGFQIVEVPWNGSSYGTPVVLDALGLPDTAGIAVDAFGNLFFSDGEDQKVVEMAWTGTGYGSPTTIAAANGLHSPFGLAVDANRNLYIADADNNRVVELPWTNSGYTSETVLVTGLFFPQAVAVDAAGDVYVANSDAGTAIELPANGAQFTLGFGILGTSNGLAVDSSGNIYVSDATNNHVVKLTVSNPPSLSFASTNGGSISADSPRTVTVWNIGIGDVGFQSVSYPTGFPKNSSDTNLCQSDNAITGGASCDVSVNFMPATAGPFMGNVVLEDNNLNQNDSTQSIAVSGTGAAASLTAQTITFTQPTTPVTYSSSLVIPLSAIGGGSGNPVLLTLDASSSYTGTYILTGSSLTIASAGTYVIDANQAGNASYSAAPQVQRTLVITQAPQTITFTQPTTPLTYSSGLTIPLSATGGASGNSVIFSIDASSTGAGSINGSQVIVTSTGSFVIDANQAGNTNYTAAPQVQRTVVVNAPGAQAINFAQPATPVTYSSGLTVPLAATGGASGNPVVFTIDASSTGAGSISGSTLTVTTVGSLVIDANQAGNASYTAAPQVQQTVAVTQAPQVINFTQPSSPVTYSSGLTVPLIATGGASGNAVVLSIDDSSTGTGTISGSTLTVTKAGNIVIDASQAGNADYSAAPQVQRTVVVNVPAPDFSVSSTTASQSVAPGGSAMYSVTVADVGSAFTGTVTLSVTGLPTGATGTFSPASVVPGSTSAPSTLAVAIPATASVIRPSLWPVTTPVLAVLLLLPFRRWRKVWRGKLLLLVAGLAGVACAASLTGCGGGFGLIQSQTYTLTITGTSGTDTHSTTVQLTVAQ